MKPKLNFDLNSIQQFLLRNVEKFVFGLVLLAFLFLVLGAYHRVGGYPKTPEELRALAEQAEKKIEDTQPEESGEVPPFYSIAQEIRVPLEAAPYAFVWPWKPPVWPERVKRGEPKYFTVEQLRASPGHGAVAMAVPEQMDEEAAEIAALSRGLRGQRWIVVTGLIPIEEQERAYRETFQNAEYRDANKDTPQAIYYWVERAEVGSPGATGQLNWTELHTYRALNVMTLWSSPAQEIVHPKYLHASSLQGSVPMAFPLPPRATGDWGPEIAHEPSIPLYAEPDATTGALAGYRGSEDEEYDEDDSEGGSSVFMPGRVGMFPMTGGTLPEGPSAIFERPTVEEIVVEQEVVPYHLFRFFDFDVEPGKHYRYRVKLAWLNPNWGVEPRFLVDESLADKGWRETDWSNPTDWIWMPRDAEILLVSVRPALSVTVEPKATVGVPFFYQKTGTELFEEHEDMARGQLLNFLQRPLFAETETRPTYGYMGDAGEGEYDDGEEEGADSDEDEGEGYGGRTTREEREARRKAAAEARAAREAAPKVDFITNAVLLDLQGGRRMPGSDKDFTEPGKLLLLDPNGNLVVRDELADLFEYQKYRETEVRPTTAAEEYEEEAEEYDEDEY